MLLDKQTEIELEFDEVKSLLSKHCNSQAAKDIANKISIFRDKNKLDNELQLIKEIYDILFVLENHFPSLHFIELKHEFDTLRIEGAILTLEQIINILRLCKTTHTLLKFTHKNKEEYPLLVAECDGIENIDPIYNSITSILNDKDQIKDDASEELARIRSQIKSTRKEINKVFDGLLRRYKKDDVIGDIEEAFLENRRLLSVLSSHKKRVPGRSYGSSTGGTLTYIEPFETRKLNDKKEQLEIEERNEILKILKQITNEIRTERHHIKSFQRLIIRFDVLKAKTTFAHALGAVLPIYNFEQKIELKDAIHPLLYLTNKRANIPTLGQDIVLDDDNRFLVISGPNAGGKSVTLKTVGLLQVMFQAGLFITVHENSKIGWYEKILSDIGDNQSIENQLSTYSYRLHRMNYFLKEVNSKTLLLLDEFGSGSDPELGGALAEVLYERLYAKNCFAVITTHYANIKLLTSSLPQSVNACMLFDTEKLAPLYKLSIGQPGSSFTFEVAQLNNIPKDILKDAKGRVHKNKVKLDQLTVDLQKRKSEFEHLNKLQKKSEKQANHILREYEAKFSKLQDQARRQEAYFEQNNKFITTGKRIFDFIKKYKKHKTNKSLNEDVAKFVAMEKAKVNMVENPVVLRPNLKPSKIVKDQLAKMPKPDKKVELQEIKQQKKPIEVGSRVRMSNSAERGVVKEIKGKKASVLFGNFLIDVKILDLTRYI